MNKSQPSVIKTITARNFRKYGKLITYPNKSMKGTTRNLWRIVDEEPARVGWRIAYLILRDKSIGRMERHTTSKETFEPIQRTCLFFVSTDKDLSHIECFELNRPIILNRGVWHGLITLGDECEIKITENAKITCQYWRFGFRIKNLDDLQTRIARATK